MYRPRSEPLERRAIGRPAPPFATAPTARPALMRDPEAPTARPGWTFELERPRVRGKFLFLGDEKLWVRGVTYGTFRPDDEGNEFHDRERVDSDFAEMAAHGVNAVRTYTVPPVWLLDTAQRRGLRVLVGVPWEQHVAFLDEPGRGRAVEQRVRAGVAACRRHPAVLCYAIGNEIPASIVRWHGHRRIERFIERLYRAAKAEDPQGLVTYVNYPTTEYIELPFLDLVSFNVFLESEGPFEAYLARLQNLAGDRPLIVAELGLDSARHGDPAQARAVEHQIRTAFAAGCAGAFVFAWTDEWHRGGHDIQDWSFGLTRRDRRPRPALSAVRRAFAEVPFPKASQWPRISVVVCSYNGAKTIRECFEGLLRVDYPNYEVIVVNDGSSDRTAAITQEYGFRLISGANRGLSSARNTGLEAAMGDIVAYIDDDAYPDPHWLTYLADSFRSTSHVGVGGPNIAPCGDGPIAECVANAPGGPVHVLLSDREAEHIPGCNMAFRKTALEAIGGFDPQFRTAGDDVDVCWRLQEKGGTLGFHPAAVVWHHRRNSIGAYWKQQRGYGRAEALLERKWPEKYNDLGHPTWTGRLYGKGSPEAIRLRRERIYHGTWGTAPFQSSDHRPPGLLASLPLIPEWYLLIALLAGLSLLGVSWRPLLLALPLLALAVGACLAQAGLAAARAPFDGVPRSRLGRVKLELLTTLLHVLHPLARLRGRLASGLTPWRRAAWRVLAWPHRRVLGLWRENWRSAWETLGSLEAELRAKGARVRRGGDFDRWDLEVSGGALGAARLFMAIEEHGAGKQLARFRVRPRVEARSIALIGSLAALCSAAALDQGWFAALVLGAMAGLLGLRAFGETAGAAAALIETLRDAGAREE